jgi:hypothetical protein
MLATMRANGPAHCCTRPRRSARSATFSPPHRPPEPGLTNSAGYFRMVADLGVAQKNGMVDIVRNVESEA